MLKAENLLWALRNAIIVRYPHNQSSKGFVRIFNCHTDNGDTFITLMLTTKDLIFFLSSCFRYFYCVFSVY